jgi:hypothetical protein
MVLLHESVWRVPWFSRTNAHLSISFIPQMETGAYLCLPPCSYLLRLGVFRGDYFPVVLLSIMSATVLLMQNPFQPPLACRDSDDHGVSLARRKY